MSRYIDADAWEEKMWKYPSVWGGVIKELREQPTADVREVVRGEDISDKSIGHWEFKCSVCGADAMVVEGGSLDGAKFNYCPNCGAKMDERREDEI